MNKSNEFSQLCSIIECIVTGERMSKEVCLPPLFSFEGLPGAGKTTQIKLVAESNRLGACHFIDIPTHSSIGYLLRSLYSNKKRWVETTHRLPWLNPLLVSLDLRCALEEAALSGAKCALMSRGILSTYYYNLSAFISVGLDAHAAWDSLSRFLKGFILPNAVIFLDIPVRIAHARVMARNREPLREMDTVAAMKNDNERLRHYLYAIKPQLAVHTINANLQKNYVTENICNVILPYLEKINE